MVAAQVRGIPTKLIIDSGATEHVLTIDLAKQAGLTYRVGDPGTDVAGSAVPSWNVDETTVDLSGKTVALSVLAAVEGPQPFAEWGVGGFLSPQRLMPEATVVLDLITNRLLVLDGAAEAVRAHLSARYEGSLLVAGVRHSSGTLGVTLSVLPFDPVVAIFDTGADGTEVAAIAVAADGLPPVASGRGVGGTVIEVGELPEQVVRVGEARFALPVLSVRDRIPTPEGAKDDEVPHALIGMDLMKGTVLAIAPEHDGSVWWFVDGRHAASTT